MFAVALDKKSRDASLPNTQRYVALIVSMPAFAGVYGQVIFCKDANFKPASLEVKQQAEKPQGKPEEKKE